MPVTIADLSEAQREAHDLIVATPTATLLRTAYALTHRIEQATARLVFPGEGAAARADLADLRAARDVITNEVLRRTGEDPS